MSYKFDSLIIILRKLDNRKKVTIDSLKDELEVSERTAYRYLRTLQTALSLLIMTGVKEAMSSMKATALQNQTLP